MGLRHGKEASRDMWCLFADSTAPKRSLLIEEWKGVLKMLYRINMITEHVGFVNNIGSYHIDGWASEPIRLLVQSVAEEMGKEAFQPYEGDAQFMIKGDPYRLIFQYDDVFGSCVILDKMEDKDAVVALLQRHFEKLKNTKG